MNTESSNVHYLTPEQIERWRNSKIINDLTEEIDLDPVAGRPVIGTLTAEEQIAYREVVIMRSAMSDYSKELAKRAVDQVSTAIDRAVVPEDIKRLSEDQKLFESDDEASHLFMEDARLKYLEHAFWYMLRNRLSETHGVGVFGKKLGIRAGFCVVDLGKKYI